jgi:LysM repeat protein
MPMGKTASIGSRNTEAVQWFEITDKYTKFTGILGDALISITNANLRYNFAAAEVTAKINYTVEITIESGSTVSGIAAKYGSTIESIKAANNLNADAYIKAGEKLIVPVSIVKTEKMILE